MAFDPGMCDCGRRLLALRPVPVAKHALRAAWLALGFFLLVLVVAMLASGGHLRAVGPSPGLVGVDGCRLMLRRRVVGGVDAVGWRWRIHRGRGQPPAALMRQMVGPTQQGQIR